MFQWLYRKGMNFDNMIDKLITTTDIIDSDFVCDYLTSVATSKLETAQAQYSNLP